MYGSGYVYCIGLIMRIIIYQPLAKLVWTSVLHLSASHITQPTVHVILKQSYVFVGEHVYIGENSIVNCAQVGSYVHIGKNCVLGRLSMLKDCCAILDGTVLAPDTVVPPFAVFAGNPGKQVGELPEITQELMIDFTWSFYRNLLPMSKKPPEQEDANKS